ncbi:MAG TPA: GlsB/YeaQ/YmgE family stress response membrane protein [Deinococcales bacterium]|nr:GlsB/YeaQ/YmgE family stress response membrane protein [Deinococcales bacterium]
MDWIIAILVGALIGWLASLVMHTDAQQGAIANILIGIVGSFLGRWLFGSVLGFDSAGTAGSLSLAGILFGVLGAIILIFLLRALRVLR